MSELPLTVSPTPLPAEMELRHMALLGDAVYELLLREVLLERHAQHPLPWRTLVQLKNHGAKAETQTLLLHTLLETFTDDTTANLVRRGRNLSHTGRKRSSQANYRQATALEVLVGVWWQQGNQHGLAHLKTRLTKVLAL